MSLRNRLQSILARPMVSNAIIVVILINAVVLGMETSAPLMAKFGPLIVAIDTACLAIFVVELLAKMYVQRLAFFRNGWNLFDFVIVGISLVPGGHTLSVLRALRVLRLLRVISVAPALRRVVEGFVRAIPGMGSVIVLMGMIFYISAVLATQLFGPGFPEWFGDLGASTYSLFQIMTLESWSHGIVRPIMDVHPNSWIFFVLFVVISAFAALNLFIGILVNAMDSAKDEQESHLSAEEVADPAQLAMLDELREIRAEVKELRTQLEVRPAAAPAARKAPTKKSAAKKSATNSASKSATKSAKGSTKAAKKDSDA
uniref:ion transporter n=1 Tax=Pararhodobacter marinus TaxID=2184063 RepID=UPI003511CB22